MSDEFDRCILERKLVTMKTDVVLIEKEVREAEFDLTSAKESIERKNYKWATVQSYYSMFHTAKALVLSRGHREKSHYCLLVALRELFHGNDILEYKYIVEFEETMGARKDADYGLAYSLQSAEEALKNAENFMQKAKQILKISHK